MNDCGLLEVPFPGSVVSCSNGDTAERLDRGLMNTQGSRVWSQLHEQHLDVGASDHLALLFNTEGRIRGRRSRCSRRFQFESFWLREQGCGETVNHRWDNSSCMLSLRT